MREMNSKKVFLLWLLSPIVIIGWILADNEHREAFMKLNISGLFNTARTKILSETAIETRQDLPQMPLAQLQQPQESEYEKPVLETAKICAAN